MPSMWRWAAHQWGRGLLELFAIEIRASGGCERRGQVPGEVPQHGGLVGRQMNRRRAFLGGNEACGDFWGDWNKRDEQSESMKNDTVQ